MSFNRDTLLDTQNKIIGQSTHGLTLAYNLYFSYQLNVGKMKKIYGKMKHI